MEAPLVLLPGMNCSADLWARVEGAAGALHPRLTESSLDAQVERLLDELPERFTLAGLSLGAIVAMALVRRAPERVSRLILLSTNPYAPTPAQLVVWRTERERLASGTTARELQESWLPTLLSEAGRRPELVERTLAMAEDIGETALDAQLRLQATRVDERAWLPAVRCPTTIIAAGADVLCPVTRHQELADLIPDARLTVLPSVGHLSPLEAPVLVCRAAASPSTAARS